MSARVYVRLRSADTLAYDLFVYYFGATTWALSPETIRRTSAVARPIAERIAAVCAPRATTSPSCRVEGFGKSRSCDP
jgi:hypothetical protein